MFIMTGRNTINVKGSRVQMLFNKRSYLVHFWSSMSAHSTMASLTRQLLLLDSGAILLTSIASFLAVMATQSVDLVTTNLWYGLSASEIKKTK